MSERISIVVPDGTIEKLNAEAKRQDRSQSNLARKFILDGLNNSNQLTATIRSEDLKFLDNRGRSGNTV
jgi:hypothetical protein